MELFTQTNAAVEEEKVHTGSESFTISAGKKLKIETSPQGSEILSITVPEGKVWKVTLTISISETNV